MTRDDFTKLYYSMSNIELGKKLNVHPQTVANKAKRLKLKPKGKGYQYETGSTCPEKIVIID